MPSGKTHAKTTAIVGAVSTLYPFTDIVSVVLFSSGCFIGLVIYPDLDVDVGNYGYHIIRVVFGRKLAKVWGWFWWAYAKIIPHRSWISHFPVVGTAIRVAYIGLPLFVLISTLGYNYEYENLLFMFYGLALVDAVHFVMDIVSTGFKRMRR